MTADAEKLNQEIAKIKGWKSTGGLDWEAHQEPPPKVWYDDAHVCYAHVCYTTPSAAWCGILEEVVEAGWILFKDEGKVICHEEIKANLCSNPDIYLAVAAAFVEMKKGEG